MLISKLKADGNTRTFGAAGADVSLIAKMSGSFLKHSEQTSLRHTHTLTHMHKYLRKAVCSESNGSY